jgi:tetratricopeptide (TPR) repeat protein
LSNLKEKAVSQRIAIALLLASACLAQDNASAKNYQTGTLISITGNKNGGAASFDFIIELDNVVYFATAAYWGWEHKPDLASHRSVDVRLSGRWMYLKRPNGKEFKILKEVQIPFENEGDLDRAIKKIVKDLKNAYDRDDLEMINRELHVALVWNPGDALVHYSLGLALEAQDRLAQALEQYRDVQQLKPDHAGAKAAIRRIESKSPDKARPQQ